MSQLYRITDRMSGAVLDKWYILIRVDEEARVSYETYGNSGYGVIRPVYLVFDDRGVVRWVTGEGVFVVERALSLSKGKSVEEVEGSIYSQEFVRKFRLRDLLTGRVNVKNLDRFVRFHPDDISEGGSVRIKGSLSNEIRLEKGGVLRFTDYMIYPYPFEVIFKGKWEVEGEGWDGVLREVHMLFDVDGEVARIYGMDEFTEYEYIETREYELSPPEDVYAEYESEEVSISPAEPFDLQDVLQGVVNERNCVEFLAVRVV